MNPTAGRRLAESAWIALAVHAVAGLAMLLVLDRGLATNPDLPDRMRFVADHVVVWRAAWFTWNLAALSILYLFVRFAKAHAEDGPDVARRCRAAVWIGVAAVTLDLSAEALMMFSLPEAARAGITPGGTAAVFLAIDRAAVLLTGFAANAGYTLATVILAFATRRAYPFWTWSAGVAVGVVGTALSLAALIDSTTGLFWSTGALVPLLTVWQLGVAIRAGAAQDSRSIDRGRESGQR